MSERFCVSAEDACVQGHFPGAPIVPGAYLLAQLERSFRQRHPSNRLGELKKVKFIAPVLPGDEVHVEWDESRWPALKAALTVRGRLRLQAQALVSEDSAS
ncbi:MaoC/PaaZ C-terminal domain-containing protein [Gilvimarinus algae]|uniref:MaoC/PaaZ C-terminal domain-containing protein n=1 Tax=Gilvimarinus algae TaxID=3058037 RepID=A0ABT8TK21_9GAMM|nr:MaoC/PaaZ C-terminal domain-containing protein [Gilvimarinus sp. SDUM040014]MDO3383443.1 MaoC/PaaZ C-terminal domain-containing protein [Gilvimarinus sp. SDUM040014]